MLKLRPRLPTLGAALLSAALYFFALPSPLSAASPTLVRLEVVGTSFHAVLSDGTMKKDNDLVGAVLSFSIGGKIVPIRIASVVADEDGTNADVLLYDFRLADTNEPICSPAPDGIRAGFPLSGHTGQDSNFEAATTPSDFEIICASGAQGKCVRFGYYPWEKTGAGRSMLDYYNSCVRMIRADYCGTGESFTKNGMLIDLWDDIGIRESATNDNPDFSFEAGWGPSGALCVAHTRVPEKATLEKLSRICPKVAELPTCDEKSARAAGALLFNRSR